MRESSAYYGSKAPGVYLEEQFGLPRGEVFATGVPAFLGPAPADPKYVPRRLSLWSHFQIHLGEPAIDSYLGPRFLRKRRPGVLRRPSGR